MENQKQTSFTFEIDNFSKKEAVISSPKFSSGGCEWFVEVFPKGYIVDDYLSLYLFVANSESLRLGWKRRASYSFALLNESGKELFKTKESSCQLFCGQFSGWGREKAVSLKKLKRKGFVEKNKLIVKVEVKVVEVVDEGDVTGKEMLDIRGFRVLYSKVISVGRLFIEHPDIAENFKLKNQLVKTTYMNLLLDLIQTPNKPPHSISETELSRAQSELMELTEAGFKLDWLKTMIDEVSLERKKENARVQEEFIKNLKLELNNEKSKTVASAAKVMSLEQTVSNLQYELNKEKQKSATKVLSLEKTVSEFKGDVLDLRYVVSDLKDEVSALEDELKKEKRISDTSAAKVLSLEQTVSDLRDELKKEKVVACSWEVLDYEDVQNYK